MPLPSVLSFVCAALGLSVCRVAEAVLALAAVWGWHRFELWVEANQERE